MDKYSVVKTFDTASMNELLHRNAGKGQFRQLMAQDEAEKALKRLMDFKRTERKDDPERRQGIHGIYEQGFLLDHKRLPDDYYEDAECKTEPWGLRLQESRSNILWQVLSRFVDGSPGIASAYLSLVLDEPLSRDNAVDDYVRELGKLHADYSRYIEADRVFHTKNRKGLAHKYNDMVCAACSIGAALAVTHQGMSDLFKQLLPLKPEDRHQFLKEHHLISVLNIRVPSDEQNVAQTTQLILDIKR